MAKVLVVEDENGLREFLAETLELDEHEVSQAEDGEQAISLMKARGYDLVISDLKMPQKDGMALLPRVRAEQPEVELVMFTAHGDVRTAVEAMKPGPSTSCRSRSEAQPSCAWWPTRAGAAPAARLAKARSAARRRPSPS